MSKDSLCAPSRLASLLIVAYYSYPNPYMSDRLGTTGPLLIQSTNLVTIFVSPTV